MIVHTYGFINFYSVSTSDRLEKKSITSTTEIITTASNYMEGYATSTENPWWNYFFRRNPGYQILTLDPRWIYAHGIGR